MIPPRGRKAMLCELHDGHPGATKMKALARMYFWWPGLDKDIELSVQGCCHCQEQQSAPPAAPMQNGHPGRGQNSHGFCRDIIMHMYETSRVTCDFVGVHVIILHGAASLERKQHNHAIRVQNRGPPKVGLKYRSGNGLHRVAPSMDGLPRYSSSKIMKIANFSSKMMHVDVTYYIAEFIVDRISLLSVHSPH